MTITFTTLLKDESLKKALKDMRIVEPTPIQEKALPLLEGNHDVICQASTGSGKTLAFAIPLAEKINIQESIQAIVLVPTRELCEQVTEEFRKVVKYKQINILEVYGGVSIENQIRKLPKAHVIVATPGRACDLLNRRVLRLDRVKTLVLDEADRMLDMGFIKDVEILIRATPNKRQTLMFSATLPKGIQHITRRHMKDPKVLKTKEQVDKNLLKQYYYDVPIRDRFHLLVHLLQKEKAPYAIVFCGTRRAVDLITYNLNQNGIDARAIHGGLTQAKRKQVMDSFHGKKAHILVASDIAARGLDIKLLTHVYNFDVPKTPEEYTHRIGRTARAGEEGIAITLVSEKDYDNFRRVLQDRTLKIEKLQTPSVPITKFTPRVQSFNERPRRFQGRSQGPRRFGNRGQGNRSQGGRYVPRQRSRRR